MCAWVVCVCVCVCMCAWVVYVCICVRVFVRRVYVCMGVLCVYGCMFCDPQVVGIRQLHQRRALLLCELERCARSNLIFRS